MELPYIPTDLSVSQFLFGFEEEHDAKVPWLIDSVTDKAFTRTQVGIVEMCVLREPNGHISYYYGVVVWRKHCVHNLVSNQMMLVRPLTHSRLKSRVHSSR